MARYDAWVKGFARSCWEAYHRESYPGQSAADRRERERERQLADMIPDDDIPEKPMVDDADPLAVECG